MDELMIYVRLFQVGVMIFRGNYPGGSLIGGNFPGGNFPGGNFPRTYLLWAIRENI